MHSYTIDTPRLLLRPLSMDDAEAEFVWLSDPEVNRYMPYSLYTSLQQVHNWLTHVMTVENAYHFGFVRKSDGLLIGAGDIKPDEESGSWELGYNFRRDVWNQGYGTEAARAMIDFAYREFGVRDFVAAHASANPASGRVLEHCGMKLDRLGQYSRFDGSETFDAKFYCMHLD